VNESCPMCGQRADAVSRRTMVEALAKALSESAREARHQQDGKSRVAAVSEAVRLIAKRAGLTADLEKHMTSEAHP
jgi:hypothetical protein